MNKIIANISALFGSYGMSLFSFLQDINMLGFITGAAGAVLTAAMAYKEYHNALHIKAQTDSIKVGTELKKQGLNEQINETGEDETKE